MQTKAKRKFAIQKCKLADADLREAVLKSREAVLKKKLCRVRAQHAKDVLNATNVYAHHVKWTIERSNYRDSSSKVTTVTESGPYGTKGTQTISIRMRAAEHTHHLVNHFVNIPDGSMAITLD